MALHGKTVIELTDVNTGEVERYEETNMLTNAIKDAYSMPVDFSHMVNYGTVFDSPLNFFRGVKLLSATMPEDPNKYFPPASNVVGYANNTSKTSADPMRGNPSLEETGKVDNGYKFVWDFTKEEANGSIACVCLTTSQSGGARATAPVVITTLSSGSSDILLKNGSRSLRTVYLKEKSVLVSVDISSTGFTFNEIDVADDNINVFKNYGYGKTVFSRSFTNAIASASRPVASTNWNVVEHTGNILCIMCTGSNLNYMEFSGADYSLLKSGTFTLSGVTFMNFDSATSLSAASKKYCEISDDRYLFIVGNDRKKIYVVDYESGSLYKEHTMSNDFSVSTGTSTYYCSLFVNIGGGVIYATNGSVTKDEILKEWSGSYLQRGYVYLNNIHMILPTASSFAIAYNPNFVSTINNLQNPVIKTADKTMRITYTITEA